MRALDLDEVSAHPERYSWFDFRPDVKKLILAGAAEREHIAILWYPAADGGVGLHHHAKTEAVYVIAGAQADQHGEYPAGTVYFNPPGSQHRVTRSSGFFLLAYAAPPDFSHTEATQAYAPVRVDLTRAALVHELAFESRGAGVSVHTLPLAADGGMRAELIALAAGGSHVYRGNYVLVLRGECAVGGRPCANRQLVVSEEALTLAAAASGECLLLGVRLESAW